MTQKPRSRLQLAEHAELQPLADFIATSNAGGIVR